MDLSYEALSILPKFELTFLEHVHYFKTFNCGVGCFHRLKPTDRIDQSFQL
jgi:hypothetical protein